MGILKWFELSCGCLFVYLEVNPVEDKGREPMKNAKSLAEPTLAAKQVFNVEPSRDVKHDRYRLRELLMSRVKHCIR